MNVPELPDTSLSTEKESQILHGATPKKKSIKKLKGI